MNLMQLVRTAVVSLAVMGASSLFAYEAKVGLVDGQILLQKSLYAQSISNKLKEEFGERKDKLEAKEKDLRIKQENLQRDRDILAEKERVSKERDITKMQEELQRLAEDFESDVQRRQEKEMAEFQRVVDIALESLSKEEKLDLILPTNVAMFKTGKTDYTYKVLTQLDKQFKDSQTS